MFQLSLPKPRPSINWHTDNSRVLASAAISHNRINEAWSLAIQNLFKDA